MKATSSRFVPSLIVLSVALAVGCGKKEETPTSGEAPTEAVPAAAKEAPAQAAAPAKAVVTDAARELYKGRCETCHGANGDGTGPGAEALKTKPRNYADAEWQKSVTDEQIAKSIIGGGMAVGKSAVMPANPDLRDQPELMASLVALIRSFGAE